ncbi:MAG: VanZ family protein [Desulfotomaculum sp.]|nr:VanZ family protein [Desulfotomaculum sp.]
MKKLLAWGGVIILFLSLWHLSSQPGLQSVPVLVPILKKINCFFAAHGINTKELLMQLEHCEKIRPLYQVLKQNPNLAEFIVRKTAHVVLFFILTIWVFILLKIYLRNFFPVLVLSSLISLSLAVVDEMHQSFVPGRAGRWFDVGIDLVGITLAFILLVFSKMASKLRETNK